MTKLLRLLLLIAIAFAVWAGLLTDFLPFKITKQMKDVVWPMPIFVLIVFACYSIATIGYRVATFNDCVKDAEELKQEIKEAKKDLASKGYKFD